VDAYLLDTFDWRVGDDYGGRRAVPRPRRRKNPPQGYSFHIRNPQELHDLGNIADRYETAAMIDDGMEDDEKAPTLFHIPEHVAWEARTAAEIESGHPDQIPLLGGRLGDEIHAMLRSVV